MPKKGPVKASNELLEECRDTIASFFESLGAFEAGSSSGGVDLAGQPILSYDAWSVVCTTKRKKGQPLQRDIFLRFGEKVAAKYETDNNKINASLQQRLHQCGVFYANVSDEQRASFQRLYGLLKEHQDFPVEKLSKNKSTVEVHLNTLERGSRVMIRSVCQAWIRAEKLDGSLLFATEDDLLTVLWNKISLKNKNDRVTVHKLHSASALKSLISHLLHVPDSGRTSPFHADTSRETKPASIDAWLSLGRFEDSVKKATKRVDFSFRVGGKGREVSDRVMINIVETLKISLIDAVEALSSGSSAKGLDKQQKQFRAEFFSQLPDALEDDYGQTVPRAQLYTQIASAYHASSRAQAAEPHEWTKEEIATLAKLSKKKSGKKRALMISEIAETMNIDIIDVDDALGKVKQAIKEAKRAQKGDSPKKTQKKE